MMKRVITLLLAALLLAACAPAALAEESSEYYIHTENGHALNVRSEPNGEVIGSLEEGSRVKVESLINDHWAMILFEYDNGSGMGEWPAYVSRRFLTKENPAEAPSTEPREDYTGDALVDMNAEFAAAVSVTPYWISIRPPRVTSWVIMRWTPDPTGMVINRYNAGDRLSVLKELKHYLQVQDPVTGDVGYIEKQYAADDIRDN